MDSNKRGTMPPIPADVKKILTLEQSLALRQLESFGWCIKFVRRPLFQQVIIVITSSDGKEYGVLETDGRLNMTPDITLREATEQNEANGKLPSKK